MPSKLTDRLCERTRPNPTRDVYLRDDVVSGFALRILPSGTKTFELRCRINGRLRRMSLGAYVPDADSAHRDHPDRSIVITGIGHRDRSAATLE